MYFDILIDTTDMSLLLVIREMIPFVRGEVASKVPEECWLLSNQQKSFYRCGFLGIPDIKNEKSTGDEVSGGALAWYPQGSRFNPQNRKWRQTILFY